MSSRSSRVASWRLSYTTSTIYDSIDSNGDNVTGESDVDNDCDYSVSEVSSSFTFRPSSMLMPLKLDNGQVNENDDTDIELDDEFNEDSIVTFKPTPATKSRFRKVTVIERPTGLLKHNSNSNHSSHSHHSKCSTLCASTYQASRERKRAQSTIVNPMISSLPLHRQMNGTSTSDETSASEIESSFSQNKATPTRRKSKFVIKKEQEKKVIEGKWKLVGNINYEEYLTEVGTGACTSDMVMRADMVIVIGQ